MDCNKYEPILINKISSFEGIGILAVSMLVLHVLSKALKHFIPTSVLVVILGLIYALWIIKIILTNTKVFISVNENNDLELFTVQNKEKTVTDVFKNSDIAKLDVKTFTNKLIIDLNDGSQYEVELGRYQANARTVTLLKALLLKYYSDRVPQTWATEDKDVINYVEKGELPIVGLKTLKIILVIVAAIILIIGNILILNTTFFTK